MSRQPAAGADTGADTRAEARGDVSGHGAAEKAPEIRRRLLIAYDGGKRDLPWRGETDPYRIWVSEVMLQQTRVETVIPYYMKWMERFPSLEDLALSEEEEVLGVWQGLGYYSRARRLHGAARVVRERYHGALPSSAEELRALPGVGAYTAGAVASMAFGEPVPAVDGNVRRVVSRLFDLPDPSMGELRALAGELVDPSRPGDFNEALMELGGTLCTPRAPACGECPLSGVCAALEVGSVGERPARKKKKPLPEVEVAVVVAVWHPGSGTDGVVETGRFGPDARVLLRKRPATGLLAGMWEFPGVEVVQAGEDMSEVQKAAVEFAAELGVRADPEPVEMETVTQVFSHLRASYRPFLFPVGKGRDVQGCRWVFRAQSENLPLPVAQRRIEREVWGEGG